jgi:hypothetical protein
MFGDGKPPVDEQFRSRVSPSWYLRRVLKIIESHIFMYVCMYIDIATSFHVFKYTKQRHHYIGNTQVSTYLK